MASWPSGSYSVLPGNRLVYSPWQAVCFILFIFYFLVYYFSLCLFLNDHFFGQHLVRFRYHKYLFSPNYCQLEQFHTKQLIRWEGIWGWLRVAFCAASVQITIQGALTSHHHQTPVSSALDPWQFTYYHGIVLEDSVIYLFHGSSLIAPSQNSISSKRGMSFFHSAFNTIQPQGRNFGSGDCHLAAWTIVYLINRPQYVRLSRWDLLFCMTRGSQKERQVLEAGKKGKQQHWAELQYWTCADTLLSAVTHDIDQKMKLHHQYKNYMCTYLRGWCKYILASV